MSRRRTGRPPLYDQQPVFAHICERIAHGESLAAICRDPSMSAESTVYRWLKSSAKADRLRQALQQVDLQNEFREFLREKFARVRA
jgi:Bacteriophage Sf6, terminase small subunit-like